MANSGSSIELTSLTKWCKHVLYVFLKLSEEGIAVFLKATGKGAAPAACHLELLGLRTTAPFGQRGDSASRAVYSVRCVLTTLHGRSEGQYKEGKEKPEKTKGF